MNPQIPTPTPPASSMPPATTMPQQKKSFPLIIVLVVLLVTALAFGGWAYTSKQSAQKSANTKLATANTKLAQAEAAQTAATKANEQPYKTYTGSPTYGSISFNYPKNWSAYVDETGSSQPVNGYFYPGQVPGTSGNTAFALRVELINDDYASVITQLQSSQTSSTTTSAFLPPTLKDKTNVQVGTRLDGVVGQDSNSNNLNGAMVILRVRDKTLKIYTQSTTYLSDFNNVILASLTYNP